MDEHTQKVVAGLLNGLLSHSNWEFNKLMAIEQLTIGNQAELDILKKFVQEQFERDSK